MGSVPLSLTVEDYSTPSRGRSPRYTTSNTPVTNQPPSKVPYSMSPPTLQSPLLRPTAPIDQLEHVSLHDGTTAMPAAAVHPGLEGVSSPPEPSLHHRSLCPPARW